MRIRAQKAMTEKIRQAETKMPHKNCQQLVDQPITCGLR
jgi:hypothetical protein